jgi:hypothetical protein
MVFADEFRSIDQSPRGLMPRLLEMQNADTALLSSGLRRSLANPQTLRTCRGTVGAVVMEERPMISVSLFFRLSS